MRGALYTLRGQKVVLKVDNPSSHGRTSVALVGKLTLGLGLDGSSCLL